MPRRETEVGAAVPAFEAAPGSVQQCRTAETVVIQSHVIDMCLGNGDCQVDYFLLFS